jgi:putative membrane protein
LEKEQVCGQFRMAQVAGFQGERVKAMEGACPLAGLAVRNRTEDKKVAGQARSSASYCAMSEKTTRERSIVKGAIAGMIGGLAGAGAKMLVEKIFPPRTEGQTPPSVALVEQVTGHSLHQGQRGAAMHGIHWGFGAAAGAVYGAMVEMEPSLGAWKGAAFGVTLNKLTHESVLPKLGLAAPKNKQPAQERISEWVSHAVYGIFTDAVRRAVRKAL